MTRSVITDPKALAPFYKLPGYAFTTYQPRTDWGKVARLGLQFVGGVGLLILIISPLWSQS